MKFRSDRSDPDPQRLAIGKVEPSLPTVGHFGGFRGYELIGGSERATVWWQMPGPGRDGTLA